MTEWDSLIKDTENLTRTLRARYFEVTEPRSQPYTQPPEIVLDEPLGPWPEFIMHSVSCVRSDAGKCTPCFYSKVQPVGVSSERLYASLLDQTQSILDNFDIWVLERQTREVEYPPFAKNDNRRAVMMGVATSGSIFSDHEVPPKHRHEIFRRIVEFGEANGMAFQLLIETQVHDVIRLHETGELKKLAQILEPVSVVNEMGFESADDLAREVLYAKGITRQDFETAVDISRRYGFIPAAFVFFGLHPMTQQQVIEDATKTLRYLKGLGVIPVLMYPHLQPYTIHHLLYTYGRYSIIDLRTIAAVVDELLAIFEPDWHAMTDPWLMGMEGGPPEPPHGVFANPQRIACDRCASILKSALRQLRRDYDYARYREAIIPLCICTCKSRYEEHVQLGQATEGAISLLERARRNIDFAAGKKDEYLAQLQER